MSNKNCTFVVDGNFRRRAAITRCLVDVGIHTEPFESPLEIAARWPKRGVILIHDCEDAVSQVLGHMCQSGTWLPLIAYSEIPDTRQVSRVVMAGACDYLTWPFNEHVIIGAFASAQETSDNIARIKLRSDMAKCRVSELTRRERQVLDAMVCGLPNWRIGEKLAISPRTVEIHRASVLAKLKANHTSDAIRVAVEANILS